MKLGRNMRAAPRGFSAQMGDSNTAVSIVSFTQLYPIFDHKNTHFGN